MTSSKTLPKHFKRNLFAILLLFSLFVITFAILWVTNPAPLEKINDYGEGFVMHSHNGTVIRVGLGPTDDDIRPTYVANTNDYIVKAIIAAEDGDFMRHSGVSFKGLIRAVMQNFQGLRRISGASTITMQTVRLIEPHKRNYWNKLREVFAAWHLEYALSKEEILTQYLNRSPFGSNLMGVESASQVWFGKSPTKLTLSEAALLAGLPQSPSRYRPDRHLERALKRRSYVLKRMEEDGYITHEERTQAEQIIPKINPNRRPFKHPWFCDWVEKNEHDLKGEITTTLDEKLQNIAHNAVISAADGGSTTFAAVILDVKTSAIRAMALSGDYFSVFDGQVNAATSPRLAGSTLKPFAYAMKMDNGTLTPKTILPDVPLSYGNYTPKNFSGTFSGLVTAKDALILSLNIPSIEIVNELGVGNFVKTLNKIGFSTIKTDEDVGLGIILGSVSVRLVDLAGAYATFARKGTYLPPRGIESSTTKDPPKPTEIFSEGTSYLISQILSGDERSKAAIGHNLETNLPTFAWKTGTSSGFRDVWTIAWNSDYVIAVWAGYKNGNTAEADRTGITTAAPVAWQIIRDLYPNTSPPFFPPSTIKTRKICKKSGQVPSQFCTEFDEDSYIEGISFWHPCQVCKQINGEIKTDYGTRVENGLSLLGNQTNQSRLKIKTPADGTRYKYVEGIDISQRATITLTGVPSSTTVYWFVNGTLHYKSQGNTPLILPLKRGRYSIIASTSDGTSDQISLTVE